VAGRENVAVRVIVSLGAEIGIALYDHGIVASFDVRVIDDRTRAMDEIEGVPIMAVENLDIQCARPWIRYERCEDKPSSYDVAGVKLTHMVVLSLLLSSCTLA
jgi:hypothetical protein